MVQGSRSLFQGLGPSGHVVNIVEFLIFFSLQKRIQQANYVNFRNEQENPHDNCEIYCPMVRDSCMCIRAGLYWLYCIANMD